jgi:hypothetical protein
VLVVGREYVELHAFPGLRYGGLALDGRESFDGIPDLLLNSRREQERRGEHDTDHGQEQRLSFDHEISSLE